MGNFLCVDKHQGLTFQKAKQAQQGISQKKNPAQNLFHFDDINFDSRMESGNLMLAEKVQNDEFDLWIAPDCYQTPYESKHKVWFHFRVVCKVNDSEYRIVTLRIKNINKNQIENFKNGMVPLYSSQSTGNNYKRIPNELKEFNHDGPNVEIAFQFNFSQDDFDGVLFAFTYPYKFSECIKFTQSLAENFIDDPDIYFHKDVAIRSLEGREIEILTLTNKKNTEISGQEALIPNLFPDNGTRALKFNNKKYILITARIHPCESPSNYILEAFIKKLLNKNDHLSKNLLDNFVFVIIPMLNPDGVFKGHYRCDSKGRDLNRFYDKLDVKEHPGPYAAFMVAKSLADGRLFMFLDMHSHSQKDSGFIFANYNENNDIRAECRTFARLYDIYSHFFDFNSCSFGKPYKQPPPSSIGVGKTEIGKSTGIHHCYTLESGYLRSTKDPDRYNEIKNPEKDLKKKYVTIIGINEFNEIGDKLRHAIAELVGIHPESILNSTFYHNIEGIKKAELEAILLGKTEETGGEENQGEWLHLNYILRSVFHILQMYQLDLNLSIHIKSKYRAPA